MSKEEDSWVFDSLVAFLNGPIWNAPLQSFIEEKSLIFEPNESDNDDYKKIFEEFKSLVDFMLGNFMEDIGIVPEQFQNACIETKNHVSFDNNLFEQIWAANDYGMFVRMMTRRNVELQLQALELIEKKYGITPQSFVPSSHKPILEREEASSDQSANRTTAERESKLEKEILDEVAKRFAEEDTSCTIFPSTSSSEINEVLEEKSILEEQLKTVSDGETSPGKPFAVIDGVELKKRQEYLRKQRDKLVALKKAERQKQLSTDATKKSSRPKSAKAAETVLLTGETRPDLAAAQLQVRKALAERLRHEVIQRDK